MRLLNGCGSTHPARLIVQLPMGGSVRLRVGVLPMVVLPLPLHPGLRRLHTALRLALLVPPAALAGSWRRRGTLCCQHRAGGLEAKTPGSAWAATVVAVAHITRHVHAHALHTPNGRLRMGLAQRHASSHAVGAARHIQRRRACGGPKCCQTTVATKQAADTAVVFVCSTPQKWPVGGMQRARVLCTYVHVAGRTYTPHTNGPIPAPMGG